MIRKCKTCGFPLWFSYFIMGRPFQKRDKPFKKAYDCVDLLPKILCQKLREEAFKEEAQQKGGDTDDFNK